jgi:hypothetical protein
VASIGAPFQSWETLDDAALDPPIRPLVRALNATGWVRTVFSCGGHPEERDSVRTGRRQAHVDVVTSDERRWREFARRCRDQEAAAARKGGRRAVRVVEGSLGTIPEWLAPALPRAKWRYRRLVFEPVPYDLTPDICRSVLDAALAVACAALPSPE